MAVIRVNKTSNYSVMSNYHFREKEMSLKAKGLLSQMLSLPDSWDYSIQGLVAINPEKESAIVSTLKELQKFGYLRIDKLLPNETESGRFEYVYNIYEEPQKQGLEKQDLENQGLEIQDLENQGQLNTNILNTNKTNTNVLNTNNNRGTTKRFKKPTIEEIEDYCKERNNNINASAFFDYYESKDWMIGKNRMKDWKAAIRTWERNSKQEKTVDPFDMF